MHFYTAKDFINNNNNTELVYHVIKLRCYYSVVHWHRTGTAFGYKHSVWSDNFWDEILALLLTV